MKKVISLSNVCIRNMIYSIFQFNDKRKKVASMIWTMILFICILIFISMVISFPLAKKLAPYEALDMLLFSSLRIAIILSTVILLFASHGLIFVVDDIDILWCMPISKYLIFGVRVLVIYIEALAIILVLMLPTAVACAYFSSSISWIICLKMVYISLFLAFIPTSIAIVSGGITGILSSHLGDNTVLTSILGLLTVSGVFVLVVVSSMSLGRISMLSTNHLMQKSIFPINTAVDWLIKKDGNSLLYLAMICILAFLLVYFIFGGIYEELLIRITNNHNAFNIMINKHYTKKSIINALLMKETQRFFKTPIYVINCGMGAVTLIGGMIYVLINRANINDFLFQLTGVVMNEKSMTNIALPLLIAAMTFVSVRINSSSASINMESVNLWIIKVAPIKVWQICAAKISLNLFIGIPIQIISCLGLSIAFRFSINNMLILLSFMVLFQIFIAIFGFLLNLNFPKTNASSDISAVRDSISAILSRFISLGLIACGGIIYYFLYKLSVEFIPFVLGFMTMLIMIIIIMINILYRNGEKMLLEIE